MKKRLVDSANKMKLRRKAIERLAADRARTASTHLKGDSRLVQELEIQQIELEMQNEQLRVTQCEIAAHLQRYTQLFDFAPIGYAALGDDGKVREVNHAGATLIGEPRDRVIGRRFELFVAPPHRSAFNRLLVDVLAEDIKKTCEIELNSIGSAQRPTVRVTADALSAKSKSVLLAFEDITMQKRAEANLLRAHEALREADRRKDEFLAVLSHELRTPLSTLLMRAQLLQYGKVDAANVARSGEIIERATMTQTRLIEDLLDVSRIVSGKLSLQRDRVDLATTVRAAADGVLAAARGKGVELEVQIGPVAGLIGDPTRLQQAVSNLLTNAVKFTPAKGRITITLSEVDQQARIEVRDSGSGIDAAFLPFLFERFTQADRTTTRPTGGLGLGLSIARAIVEAHRGTIRAESAGRGQGSTFIIELPLAGRRSDAPMAPFGFVAPDDKIRGGSILVVEDDAGTRATLIEVLRLAGAEVRDADGGVQAMKVLDDFEPDLLVCDIGMPNEDGCNLLRRIRAREAKHGRGVSALALTAFATEKDRARTREAGFDEHLAKPVDIERLLTVVSRLLPPRDDAETAGSAN